MLKIVVPAWEDWDPTANKFVEGTETRLTLEHSLVSVSKWESKYHKPFLNEESKTAEEMLDYIKFMTIPHLSSKFDDSVFLHLTQDNIKQIEDYIGDPMTATTFSNNQMRPGKKEVITSEVIYYWMVSYGIPFECQRWHLNRLITLVRVLGIKNAPPKKMGKRDIMAQNKSLNAARRAKYHSRG